MGINETPASLLPSSSLSALDLPLPRDQHYDFAQTRLCTTNHVKTTNFRMPKPLKISTPGQPKDPPHISRHLNSSL